MTLSNRPLFGCSAPCYFWPQSGSGWTAPCRWLRPDFGDCFFHGVQRFGERREYGLSAANAGGSMDTANSIDDTPAMDEKGADITPKSSEIVFDKVDFSYADRKILDQVSFTIPEKTTTAIVGPSGQVRQRCAT